MKKLTQIRLPLDQEDRLPQTVARILKVPVEQIAQVKVIKRSLDARQKSDIHYVYTLEVYEVGEAIGDEKDSLPQLTWKGPPPLIIGAGPGGLFAALRLLDHGIPSILLERGAEVHPRTVFINMFWKKGELNPDSNVCYGEGGAGLFSDGKLITRIKSPHIRYVLERLVDFGAPAEILYVNNPHVGSDKLRKVIKRMTQHLRDRGCQLHFNTPVEALVLNQAHAVTGVQLRDGRQLESSRVILATGHSARDLYRTLRRQDVALEAKPFAMGVRIEHPQRLINQIQLGTEASEALGAAQYKLTWNSDETSVYSFCMCPGGYVLSSGTEVDGVVSNGMSNYHRNSKWANAALVVPVLPEQQPGQDPFRLLEAQRKLEHTAWRKVQEAGGTRHMPTQRLVDFLEGRRSRDLPPISSPSDAVSVNLHEVLTSNISEGLQRAFVSFDKKMHGFVSPEAVLIGVESRTSAPVRIPRDPVTLESINTPGLYPVGEGAGYAGGITSAAVDGIRAVNALIEATCL